MKEMTEKQGNVVAATRGKQIQLETKNLNIKGHRGTHAMSAALGI